MGLIFIEKTHDYVLDADLKNVTTEKLESVGMRVVSKTDNHYLVEYKDNLYDINTENGIISYCDGCLECGSLYYGFSYLYEIKKMLQ